MTAVEAAGNARQPSADDSKFRYGAALAEQIELKWQQTWF